MTKLYLLRISIFTTFFLLSELCCLGKDHKEDTDSIKKIGEYSMFQIFDDTTMPIFVLDIFRGKGIPLWTNFEIFIWMDGRIAWTDDSRSMKTDNDYYFKSKISPKKIEQIASKIKDIYNNTDSPFTREHQQCFDFPDAHVFAEQYCIFSSEHCKYDLWFPQYLEWYESKKNIFEKNDRKNLIEIMKSKNYNLLFTYRNIYADVSIRNKPSTSYSDDEIYNYARQFHADASHVLFLKKSILDLIPRNHALVSEKIDINNWITFSINIKNENGKNYFIYKIENIENVFSK
jgi:hypothetical protein